MMKLFSLYPDCRSHFRRLGGRMRCMSVRLLAILLPALLILGAVGCSTKKNTPASRNWQAFTTRYNVYFNGSEHYKEQLKQMEQTYEDDYTRTLLTHPAEARADNKMPQPTGDFKRTIEKMQKAIQLHSIKKKPAKRNSTPKEKAFRAREEFNPFLHNAWLSMGRAQFMDGDFLGAASTFFYISKHFTWLPKVVTEAKIWQARCYCALDWAYEAENILQRIKPKELTDKHLKSLFDLTEADYYVRTEKYREAVAPLTRAAKAASGSQKNRLYFLLGQVYSQLGNKRMAYDAYRKAGSGPSTAYRTKFNARIKQSEVYEGNNIKGEVRSLRNMTRYERNKEYLDQIYYAIGNLYLSRRDTVEAPKNYALAVEHSTRNGIDKALAQVALGNIYFQQGAYVKAQPCYSEAVPMLPETFPDYKTLKRRSDVLDELAVYAGNVELQDSLLRLSELPREEQEKVCQRLVDELKKREKEEAEAAAREQHMAEAEANAANVPGQQPASSFQLNTDRSWYFYNTMTKNAGKNEFQRRWGARKLEDDWRRRNKTSFAFDDTPEGDDDNPDSSAAPNDSISEADREVMERENDPHYVEYYLKQIPSTPEEKQTANDVIMEGLYNMGVILKDRLEDFPAARKEFLTLEERYPDNEYRLDVYYNMYLMAVRQDDEQQAAYWRDKIIADFPESPYGQAMRDPDYFTNLRRMNLIQEEKYQAAYDAYLADNNTKVHALTAEMEKDYPLSAILPKFVFIDALSYLTEKDYDQFKERLTELLRKWPDTDMTDMAGNIVKGLNAGRVPQSGSANSRGMLWDIRLTDNGEEGAGPSGPAGFKNDPDAPQYLVFAFPLDSVNANQVLYDVARFNFSSFVVKDFDLEQMSFSNVGLLIVKGFANMKELEHYRNVMARSDLDLPEGVRPIMISKDNFDLLLREGRSFEEYFRFEEEEAVRAREEEVLGKDMEYEEGAVPPDDDVNDDGGAETLSEEENDTPPEETATAEEEESVVVPDEELLPDEETTISEEE